MKAVVFLLALYAQDSDKLYREALYEEVDRGNLDRAIELYRKIEGNDSNSKTIRAKSSARQAGL